ncbi:hypothetical protein AB1Y20_016903 [Prymnesium parvum]|uniref:DUF659 domain-containing protein n=1 Tax=Prymnesium parvum TaxID=97485 RepID=A0AB34IBH7_PRYPA
MEGPRVGLTQTPVLANVGTKARAAGNEPKRSNEIWKEVAIVKPHMTSPTVVCNHCAKRFGGGVTRIREHILEQCLSLTPAFLKIKQKLLDASEAESGKKRQKMADAELEKEIAVSELGGLSKNKKTYAQQDIKSSISSGTAITIDNAIADFFYMAAMLLGDLLDSSTQRLKAEEEPMRKLFMKDGFTILCDGWDDIQSNHLVNLLVGTNRAIYFEGTVKLASTDSEKAEDVAKIIGAEIKSIGMYNVVQVVTDTCSVMKAAWKLLEAEYPWITCTCCAPHVLNLYLKDIGKIEEVAAVIVKVSQVLNRFWGKSRWPRARLRETTAANHGKEIGLYRAKVTRFAGQHKQMARILRLKADLQKVVVSAEYGAQTFSAPTTAASTGDDENPDVQRAAAVLGTKDPVKAMFLLDEDNFWVPLIDTLRVMTPVVKLLRLTDGVAPVMGKILPQMEAIRETIANLNMPWKSKVLSIHNERWVYLQSPMHYAGTCLDPEFLMRDIQTQGSCYNS